MAMYIMKNYYHKIQQEVMLTRIQPLLEAEICELHVTDIWPVTTE